MCRPYGVRVCTPIFFHRSRGGLRCFVPDGTRKAMGIFTVFLVSALTVSSVRSVLNLSV